jgi:WS/DGAT/MGAT family acyltransferase
VSQFHFERLGSDSASFLLVEGARHFTHATTVHIFESGPLAGAEGGVQFATIRRAIEAALARVPRYRQRLRWIPLEDYPVWIDDAEFNLDYHVRHTALPHPGAPEDLWRVAARVHSQRIDRHRPLWECWVIEGIAPDRFALLMKTHHCMLEDSGELDLAQALLSADSDDVFEDPEPFRPRPAPSRLELGREEILRRARLPRRAAQRFWAFAHESGSLGQELRRRAEAVAKLSGFTVRESSASPFDGVHGPHRRFACTSMPLSDAVEVRKRLGGSVNDVILATVAGAIRSFLDTRFMNPATLDLRVAIPVRVEGKGGSDAFARWVLDLPIWERSSARRLELIQQQTAALREEHTALGARTLFSVAQWSGSRLLTTGARTLATQGSSDLELTYVPGPEVPLYLEGARLVETYGEAPLRQTNALGISVFSYDGRLFWGLNADYDRLPDVDSIVTALEEEMRSLCRAALDSHRHLELIDAS